MQPLCFFLYCNRSVYGNEYMVPERFFYDPGSDSFFWGGANQDWQDIVESLFPGQSMDFVVNAIKSMARKSDQQFETKALLVCLTPFAFSV